MAVYPHCPYGMETYRQPGLMGTGPGYCRHRCPQEPHLLCMMQQMVSQAVQSRCDEMYFHLYHHMQCRLLDMMEMQEPRLPGERVPSCSLPQPMPQPMPQTSPVNEPTVPTDPPPYPYAYPYRDLLPQPCPSVPKPTPGASPSPTPLPTPGVSPSPAPVPSPEASPAPTPLPSPGVSPSPGLTPGLPPIPTPYGLPQPAPGTIPFPSVPESPPDAYPSPGQGELLPVRPIAPPTVRPLPRPARRPTIVIPLSKKENDEVPTLSSEVIAENDTDTPSATEILSDSATTETMAVSADGTVSAANSQDDSSLSSNDELALSTGPQSLEEQESQVGAEAVMTVQSDAEASENVVTEMVIGESRDTTNESTEDEMVQSESENSPKKV
ncbi:hypothetical protein H1S01_01265 [Heliobacterium chlorum]|uniref:Vegetative cell wall protein gp1-like n=1 Tax=Heliobacterium chlorum TaxID=2698 RepID=A0ABR7SYN7_HELCL|nr:hypothetical protein [Heliobacterium chlorum]MBC9783135.1 hypothetical protein [Heliobacterium chlorum]